MSKIKDVPIDEFEITLEDETAKVIIKKNAFLEPGDKNYFMLGENTIEGRTETTFWKSKEKMQLYIAEKMKNA